MRATVLIPTFDHGPLLEFSLLSALAQTVTNLEVFVVGDGVPDEARPVVERICAVDDRVRFFDSPKGERHGERLRHAALQDATGDIVCYLSDDDLWFPDHVAVMADALSAADFAGTLPVRVTSEGQVQILVADLGRPFYRTLMATTLENRVPLSCGAHTMDLYRRLPAGWRPAPLGVPTDLHMWRQILDVPGVRAVGTDRITMVGLHSSIRRGWTPERRLDELREWAGRVASPEGRAAIEREALSAYVGEAARLEESRGRLTRRLEHVQGTITWRLRGRVAGLIPSEVRSSLRSLSTKPSSRGSTRQ